MSVHKQNERQQSNKLFREAEGEQEIHAQHPFDTNGHTNSRAEQEPIQIAALNAMADISSAFLCGRLNLTNVDQLNDVLTTVGRHVTQVANLTPAGSAIEPEEDEVTEPHHHHEDPAKGTAPPFDLPPPVSPAVPIDQSVTDDYIICLEDGRKYRSMRRHLKTAYGLTPKAYRLRWGLPADYPVIAPNYRKLRSDIAHRTMFGAKKKGA